MIENKCENKHTQKNIHRMKVIYEKGIKVNYDINLNVDEQQGFIKYLNEQFDKKKR